MRRLGSRAPAESGGADRHHRHGLRVPAGARPGSVLEQHLGGVDAVGTRWRSGTPSATSPAAASDALRGGYLKDLYLRSARVRHHAQLDGRRRAGPVPGTARGARRHCSTPAAWVPRPITATTGIIPAQHLPAPRAGHGDQNNIVLDQTMELLRAALPAAGRRSGASAACWPPSCRRPTPTPRRAWCPM